MQSSKKLILPAAAKSPLPATKAVLRVPPKMRVYCGTKTRAKLSVLKKRILKERLQNHLQVKSIHKDVLLENITQIQRHVGIFNFIDSVDIEDKDECDEIIQNVNEIMSSFGRIESINIVEDSSRDIISACEVSLRMKLDLISNSRDIGLPYAATRSISGLFSKFIVLVTFRDSISALHSASGVNGMVFGGTPIVSILFADNVVEIIHRNMGLIDDIRSNVLDSADDGDQENKCRISNEGEFTQTTKNSYLDDSYVVRLENFVSVDDLDDKDEVDSILDELVAISSDFGNLNSVWIEKYENSYGNNGNTFKIGGGGGGAFNCIEGSSRLPYQMRVNPQFAGSNILPLSVIRCPTLHLALQIGFNLSGKVMSSNALQVSICSDDIDYTNIRNLIKIPNDISGTDSIFNGFYFDFSDFYQQFEIKQKERTFFGIKLRNFIQKEQLEDEDEKNQILSDLRDCLGGSPSNSNNRNSSVNPSILFFNSNDLESSSLDVVYIFENASNCLFAFNYYNNRIIEGLVVTPELLVARGDWESIGSLHGAERLSGNILAEERLSVLYRNDGLVLYCCDLPNHLSYVVGITGYISEEDLNNANLDRDEYVALKNDLLNLAFSSQSPSNSSSRTADHYEQRYSQDCVSKVSIITSVDHSLSSKASASTTIACLCFSQLASAEAAYCNLDERKFGGAIVSATLSVQRRENIKSDSSLPVTQAGISGREPDHESTEVGISHLEDNIFAMKSLTIETNKKSINVINSQVFIDPSNVAENSSGGGGNYDDGDDERLLNQNGNVPRQPKHAAPVYTIPVADEEINATVIKLLNDLAKFQKKLIETEPLKAKAKMRYAVGVKQVLNSVKAGRTIVVLLAPDTEVSGALDDKIGTLVDEAMANGIPIIYCLNRRKLAKSLDMSMRQSVVGVYKADGTYENFKKIKEYIERHRTPVSLSK